MITTEKQGHEFQMLSVKDELTGKFLNPIFVESEEEGVRWFTFVVNDNKIWKSNASMYNLYNLGTFSDKKGIIDTCENLICSGLSVKKED